MAAINSEAAAGAGRMMMDETEANASDERLLEIITIAAANGYAREVAPAGVLSRSFYGDKQLWGKLTGVARGPHERTAIMAVAAAKEGRTERAAWLLDQLGGSEEERLNAVNRVDDRGRTALHWAANEEVASLLVSRGCALETRDKDDRTPLYLCCEENRLGPVKALLAGGALINITARTVVTPARAQGTTAPAATGTVAAAGAAETGSVPATATTTRAVPLTHCVITKGHNDVFTALLDKDPTLALSEPVPPGRLPLQDTLLQIACEKERVEMAAELLKRGADVEMRKRQTGDTPLIIAAVKGNAELMRVLLEHGAKPDTENELADTWIDSKPAFVALKKKRDDLVFMLMDHGLGPGTGGPFPEGQTLLHAACDRGREKVVERLIKKEGADVNARCFFDDGTGHGNTPLHEACDARPVAKTGIIRMLVDAGANVNAVGALGLTPLIMAVISQSHDHARLLIELGANVNMASVDDSRTTPLKQARLARDREMMKILVDAGARL